VLLPRPGRGHRRRRAAPGVANPDCRRARSLVWRVPLGRSVGETSMGSFG
jgi:hypothetical protein